MTALQGGCAVVGRRVASQEDAALGRQMCRQGIDALECGQVNDAQRLLRQAAAADPDYSDARKHLAEALWLGGDRREAVEHAEQACQSLPLDAHNAVRAGQMRLLQGEPQAAADWASRAIAVEPRLASGWALRGRAHHAAGDSVEAVADLQQALRYAPDDRTLLRDLAELYRGRGDQPRALMTLHQLLDSYAPGEAPTAALATTGAAYLESGRPQDAADMLRVASARPDADAALLCGLAEAEAACGRGGEAIDAARRAVAADGTHLPAKALLDRLASAPATVR
ncbi:MAG: tetratricopeptide repeat protein [Planctomycetota bacterium]